MAGYSAASAALLDKLTNAGVTRQAGTSQQELL